MFNDMLQRMQRMVQLDRDICSKKRSLFVEENALEKLKKKLKCSETDECVPPELVAQVKRVRRIKAELSVLVNMYESFQGENA